MRLTPLAGSSARRGKGRCLEVRIWDDVIPKSDKEWFARGRHGEPLGFGRQPAVLVVDVTYDFVDPTFPMAAGEMGERVVRSIHTLLEQVRAAAVPVIYTQGTVPQHPAQRGRRKGAGSTREGSRIVAEIAPQATDLVIVKPKASAFFGTPLASWLVASQVDTVVVTGLVTSGCVRATVVDAASYNFVPIVVEECVGDRGVVSHKVSLFDMHMKYADVVSLREAMEYFSQLTSGRLPVLPTLSQ